MVDKVLEKAIKFALCVRDSQEAHSWREGWNQLCQLSERDIRVPIRTVDNDAPVPEYVHHIVHSDWAQARPLMIPTLLAQFSPFGNEHQTIARLQSSPFIWRAIRPLTGAMGFVGIVSEFLRNLGPGYPHNDIVYTLPSSPWAVLGSNSEIPWFFGKYFLSSWPVPSATLLGIERFVPSIGRPATVYLNELAGALKESTAWEELRLAYAEIEKNPNLKSELAKSRDVFEREFRQIVQLHLPGPIIQSKAEDLARKVYKKKGSKIQRYIKCFVNFDKLVTNIYWLLSHISIHSTIPRLSTSSGQIINVNAGYNVNSSLTALTRSYTHAFGIGKIVHLSFPETEGLLDGLYQISQTIYEHQVGKAERLFFRAECQWYYGIDELIASTSMAFIDAIVTEPARLGEGEMEMRIYGEGGEVIATLPVRKEIINMRFSHTMYLPLLRI